jgi:hypothetical protein
MRPGIAGTGVSARRYAHRTDDLRLRRRRLDAPPDRSCVSAPLRHRGSVHARRVARERHRDTHHGPHSEHPGCCPREQRMLSQPSAHPNTATASPGRAPAGINPAPRGQPSPGPPGEHVIRMHHELLVRGLVVHSIVGDSLVVLFALRRDGRIHLGLRDRCLCGPSLGGHGLRFTGRISSGSDGSWGSVKYLRMPRGKTGLARPAAPRRRR